MFMWILNHLPADQSIFYWLSGHITDNRKIWKHKYSSYLFTAVQSHSVSILNSVCMLVVEFCDVILIIKMFSFLFLHKSKKHTCHCTLIHWLVFLIRIFFTFTKGLCYCYMPYHIKRPVVIWRCINKTENNLAGLAVQTRLLSAFSYLYKIHLNYAQDVLKLTSPTFSGRHKPLWQYFFTSQWTAQLMTFIWKTCIVFVL